MTSGVYELSEPAGPGPVLVTAVGVATGSRAAAAALACAASEPNRAGLLVDLDPGRAPRPALIATAAARELEERLGRHLPDAKPASRGSICQLSPGATSPLDLVAAAAPLARDSVAVVHLPPGLLHGLLAEPRIRLAAALLRADLGTDCALTALAAGDLIDRGLRVAVLKRPLAWLPARGALFGVAPTQTAGLPHRLVDRLLGPEDNKFQQCYDRKDERESDEATTRARWGRGDG